MVGSPFAAHRTAGKVAGIKFMIKVYVLAENTASNPNFSAEHGLSLYIETNRHKILFDSGQSDIFIRNAAFLRVNLSEVDIAVLSHGHYDHGGGLETFLEINPTASLYISRHAFGEFYHGTEKYIGLSEALKKNRRSILTENVLKIDNELTLCTCNDKKPSYPMDSSDLNIKTENGFEPDQFIHEQYLTVNDGNRNIIVSGCSHKGILNIMNWCNPDVFVGGFHFMKQEVSEKNALLDNASYILSSYQTVYYTCHCTGFEQYKYLKEKMDKKISYISSGEIITL